MGSRYAWSSFGIVSFIRTLMRDHYLGFLLTLYFIIFAAFGGIFYLWAVRSPFTSTGWVEGVVDETEVVQPYAEIERVPDEIASDMATPVPAHEQSERRSSYHMTVEASPGAVASQVHINGESVALPDNGTIHRVIQDSDGSARVDMSVTSESGTNSNSSSSLKLDIESSNTATKEAE